MHVYLETERLILRRFTPDDLNLVTALDADPAVMKGTRGAASPPDLAGLGVGPRDDLEAVPARIIEVHATPAIVGLICVARRWPGSAQ